MDQFKIQAYFQAFIWLHLRRNVIWTKFREALPVEYIHANLNKSLIYIYNILSTV